MTSDLQKKIVDLHLHTTASDGKLSPEKVVMQAYQKKVSAIAITDHDTVEGIANAWAAAQALGIELIPAAEFSASFSPTMHILGFYIDIQHEDIKKATKELERVRQRLIAKAFYLLKKSGIALSLTQLQKEAGAITISSLKKYLIENKCIEEGGDIECQLSKLLEEWKCILPTPKDCIALIHKIGGIAVLAHPMQLNRTMNELERLIVELKRCGLDGVEIFHPIHSDGDMEALNDIAKKYNLLRTGGSDYHGDCYVQSPTMSAPMQFLSSIKWYILEGENG